MSLRETFVRLLLVAGFERFLREVPMATRELDDAEADETHCGRDGDVWRMRRDWMPIGRLKSAMLCRAMR